MESETILIDNLKCGGCANTIKKNVLAFSGVQDVLVSPENESVEVFHTQAIQLNEIKSRLKELGYPEKGSTEGIEKITRNLKSYISCAVGRLSDEVESPKQSN